MESLFQQTSGKAMEHEASIREEATRLNQNITFKVQKGVNGAVHGFNSKQQAMVCVVEREDPGFIYIGNQTEVMRSDAELTVLGPSCIEAESTLESHARGSSIEVSFAVSDFQSIKAEVEEGKGYS